MTETTTAPADDTAHAETTNTQPAPMLAPEAEPALAQTIPAESAPAEASPEAGQPVAAAPAPETTAEAGSPAELVTPIPVLATAQVAAETSVTFADLGLSEPVLRAVTEKGYIHPTPIQAQAIPIVLMGRDVLGCAQTGTGKTAGFTLPLLQRLARHASSSPSPARHPVRALILATTRELAMQVHQSVVTYSKHLPLRSVCI